MQHLLIVDNIAIVACAIQRYFEYHGYVVTVAFNAQQALNAAQENPIDAVIMDFRYVDTKGGELLTKLRANQPNLPAIIISGYNDNIDSAKDCKTKVVRKPALLNMLLTEISRMLGNTPSC